MPSWLFNQLQQTVVIYQRVLQQSTSSGFSVFMFPANLFYQLISTTWIIILRSGLATTTKYFSPLQFSHSFLYYKCSESFVLCLIYSNRYCNAAQHVYINMSGVNYRGRPAWAGAPPFPSVFPLVHSLHLFSFLLFPFLTCFTYFHPFPFYQNSPTLFPGRRS